MSKALIHSNAYLQDTQKREEALERNILSSSAVEGIKVTRDTQTGRFVQNKSASKASETSRSATKLVARNTQIV